MFIKVCDGHCCNEMKNQKKQPREGKLMEFKQKNN